MGFVPTEQEKNFENDYWNIYKDSNETRQLMSNIRQLVKDFPNDQELGSEIRKLITNNK